MGTVVPIDTRSHAVKELEACLDAAQHNRAEVAILCWKDVDEPGRIRMTWFDNSDGCLRSLGMAAYMMDRITRYMNDGDE